MNTIKPNPNLTPRFNIDYNTKDAIKAITHLKTKPDTTPQKNLFQNNHIN